MAEGDAGGQQCRIDVIRSEPAGTAKVTRSVLPNGQCLCTVKTGPQNNNGSAEDIVTGLLDSRSCDGAPPAGETSGGSGSGGMIGGLVGAVAVGGLAAGLGGKSKG